MVAVMAMTPVHLLHLSGGTVDLIIGLTIGLHVVGHVRPVSGLRRPRRPLGRMPTILLGQAVLAVSLAVAANWPGDSVAVVVALFLLGLGWSAATVAGAALLTESTTNAAPAPPGRERHRHDAVAAVGAISAGVILSAIGYGGLAMCALVIVIAVSALAPMGRAAHPLTAERRGSATRGRRRPDRRRARR